MPRQSHLRLLLLFAWLLCACSPAPQTQPDTTLVATDASGQTDATANTDVATAPPTCSACAVDADCGPTARCVSVAEGGKRCLPGCTTSKDCPVGLTCRHNFAEIALCVPANHSCSSCQFTGCPEGQECQLASGTCTKSQPLCSSCTNDIDCHDGDVCMEVNGARLCRPRCNTNLPCPDGSTCIPQAGGAGWCMHRGAYCCYDKASCSQQAEKDCKSCAGTCLGGLCGDCKTDADCAAPATCTQPGWQCRLCPQPDAPDKVYWSPEAKTCVECRSHDDCAGKGDAKFCDGWACTTYDACALCGGANPVCIKLNGNYSCTECLTDADCAGIGTESCNTKVFLCVKPPPPPCPPEGCPVPGCKSDADCPPDPMGLFDTYCDPPTKLCRDKTGKCDNVAAYCLPTELCYLAGSRDGYQYGECTPKPAP